MIDTKILQDKLDELNEELHKINTGPLKGKERRAAKEKVWDNIRLVCDNIADADFENGRELSKKAREARDVQ